jgi:hypothetical protein
MNFLMLQPYFIICDRLHVNEVKLLGFWIDPIITWTKTLQGPLPSSQIEENRVY